MKKKMLSSSSSGSKNEWLLLFLCSGRGRETLGFVRSIIKTLGTYKLLISLEQARPERAEGAGRSPNHNLVNLT